jgi:hypothetical protein
MLATARQVAHQGTQNDIRAIREKSKDRTGRLLAWPITQLKSSQFGLKVDTIASNQSTNRRRHPLLEIWRPTLQYATELYPEDGELVSRLG